jgi:hypothetical protein
MAGGLVHIVVGLLSALIVHLIHFKWEYSLVLFIGNLLPDALRQLLTALKQGTVNIFDVETDGFYRFIQNFTSDVTNWFSIGFFILSVLLFLYHFHYINKKKVEEYAELYGYLLLGVLTHLVMDILIIEKGIWF